MGTPLTVTEGSYVWVEDPSVVWTDGQVLKIQAEEVEIQCKDGNTVVSNISKLYPKDMEASPVGVDDMTKLLYLHEPGVLNNLACRYELNQIYTYTGNILIAVNPFERLPYLYDAEMMERYKGAPFGVMSPHVFAVADAAYRAMMDEGKSNSVLVSGESGAGKTETTKMLMRYLAFLGGHAATERRTVEQQVLESNPVLEAFGNAKTARNNNSSRFGKFVELQFDKRGKISGAAIRTYLLERSRVCQISGPERNYHCFYLLCAAPKEESEKYKLGNPTTFHYLNQSNCYEVVGLDDAESYIATRRAMSIIGMSDQEQDAIFRVVAAILHLGNINFANNEDVDSSLVSDESKFHLQMTAELLMCDIQKLQDALCTRVMVTPEEVIKRSLDPDAATVSRDGMAKTIYSRLFDWLVSKINVSIGQDHTSKSLIGILDIYGFESFQSNSFEQFCINYTNEKLQQHFNQHVFKTEQEEYIKEEIEWSYIEFVDNQDVLDLIEKKPGGIMALLDEACMFPKSTHETFSQKLYQTFRYHKRFIKPKRTRTDFSIVHYAGEVQYQSDQFLDKNKDYVVPEHQDLLSASNCSFVSGLFPPLPEEMTAKSSKFSSISSRFKLQLQQLVDTLKSTEPHYIRCVKPNNLLKPVTFENINVMQQLRSGGVLEAIRVSCAGYPTRRTFSEFLTRFRILRPELLQKKDYDEKETCKRILEMMGFTGYQIGNTKVLLRAGQMAELDAQRAAVRIGSAKAIQKQGRSYVVRNDYSSLRKASIHIQTYIRGILACKVYEQMRREAAAIVVQSYIRGHGAVTNYDRLMFSAVILQAGLRGVAARSLFRYRTKTYAATKIQASFRGHKACSAFKKLKVASLESQSTSSETLIGSDNNDTREIDAIRETKNKLEQQVDILTCNLQLERRLRTDLEQSKGHEITQLQESLKAMQNKVDETSALLVKERQAAKNVVEEWSRVKECPFQDSENIGISASEVENLKALLRTEKRRTDDLEKKYAEVLDLSEERGKKLEEAERKVQELQESLDRMLYSMCNEVSQLKMILHTPSISISTSSSFARVEQVDANSSDASSTESDFTFPAPVPTEGTFSSFASNGLQLIVQEISSDTPGSENWNGEREGAFDDFF